MPDPPLPPSPGEPSSLTELKHLSSTLQATAEALCRSSRASEATAAHGAASAKVRAALAEAEAALRLLAQDAAVAPVVPRAEVRVWMDGAFDMMHFGHANAFRPGQEKGDSTSFQRECSARARFGNSTHASRALREMIARPKISRNEAENDRDGSL